MRKLTQKEFLQTCTQVHNDKYDYSKTIYLGKDKKIIIICKEHGEFIQNAGSHKLGQGCRICYDKQTSSRCRKNVLEFIEQANKIHSFFYDYSKFNYLNAHEKSIILCPLHGEFIQNAHSHIKGHKCPRCASEQADKWGWSKTKWLKIAEDKQAKLYLIKLFNDNEEFLKVGITTKSKIESRIRQIPYDFEIIKTIEDSGENIWNLENEIKRNFRREFKYIPQTQFKGMYECYIIELLEKLQL